MRAPADCRCPATEEDTNEEASGNDTGADQRHPARQLLVGEEADDDREWQDQPASNLRKASSTVRIVRRQSLRYHPSAHLVERCVDVLKREVVD